MSTILDLVKDREIKRFEAGQIVIQQGDEADRLYLMIEGAVEVLKDDVPVAKSSAPGAAFGELSALLRSDFTATVRAVKPSSFYIIENPREFLQSSPGACMHVCELLARRLDALNRYLVDVKHQFEGHDHLGMVDEVLEALMHRQPGGRVRPKESTIREGQIAD